MTTLPWKDSYLLGVDEIDAQHKHLFALLGRLRDSTGNSGSEATVGEVIRELVQHAQVHFRDEEQLMREVGYHDFERHRALHKVFVERIVLILRRLKAGQEITARDLAEFLEQWMIEHLLGEDIKIAFAVKARTEKAGRS